MVEEAPAAADPHATWKALKGLHHGASVFYLGSGPSTKKQDLLPLQSRGRVVLAVNNAWCLVRPHLWVGVDLPRQFCTEGWMDPGVLKFIPRSRMHKPTARKLPDGYFTTGPAPETFPGVVPFPFHLKFDHETFIDEVQVNWGHRGGGRDSAGVRSHKSCMLAAFKVMIWLGFTRIYLLGCDFNMVTTGPYGWAQEKSAKACGSNNDLYAGLMKRFEKLWPLMRQRGIEVWNCTPGSRLDVFPKKEYEEALKETELPPMDETDWYGNANKERRVKGSTNPGGRVGANV